MKAKRRLLYRKKAVTLKQSHCELANLIASHAGIVCTETMNWQGLAKRAKRPWDEKTGREKSRKRYGKSVGSHAPAAFVDALSWRLLTLGGQLKFVDTYSFRASQLDHFTGECTKVKLSQRWKEVAGKKVQRDLYSAFLLWHADARLAHADATWCTLDFSGFVARQGEFLARARETKIYRNSCFGF